MKFNLPGILFFTLFFVFSTAAQASKVNILEKVDLTFYVEADPGIEEVGFNNPKSSWKIEYRLYLSDWEALKKIGRCGVKDDAAKEYCSHTTDQKLDKRIKKIATLISKRKYSMNRLAADSNRTIKENVNLSPEVIGIFNQAAQIYEKNPVFILFVKTSISTKNSAGAKLKRKYMTEGLHYLKFYKEDKTFDYWNVSKLSFGTGVVKETDGSLRLRAGYTHFGV